MTNVEPKDHTRLSSEMIARMEADPEYKRKITMEHQEFTRQKLAEMNECLQYLNIEHAGKFCNELSKELSTMKKVRKGKSLSRKDKKILNKYTKRVEMMRRKEKVHEMQQR